MPAQSAFKVRPLVPKGDRENRLNDSRPNLLDTRLVPAVMLGAGLAGLPYAMFLQRGMLLGVFGWLVVSALGVELTRRHRGERAAAWVFVLAIGALETWIVPFDGGFDSVAFDGWFPTVVAAAVLLGRRMAILLAAYASAQLLVLAWFAEGLVVDDLGIRLATLLGTTFVAALAVDALRQSARESSAHLDAASAMLNERNLEIARRAEIEAELQGALQQANAAQETRNRFLANMSHELRTPLNAILGYAEILLEDEPLEHQVADLERVVGAGQSLLSLIDHVLELTRIESGTIELDRGLVQVRPLVEKLTSRMRPVFAARRNELVVAIDEGLPDLLSDGGRVQRILRSLLSNAAKFTRDGRVRVTVTLEPFRGSAAIAIRVEDTGIGIEEEALPSLFQPFGQIDDSHTREYGGTGLGLYVGRRYARLLGGDITVESALGEGSTFALLLPVSTPLDDVSALVARRSLEARTASAPVVAVVNGSAEELQELDAVLLSLGYQPLLASTTEQLEDVIDGVQIEVVLGDLKALEQLPRTVGRRLEFHGLPLVVTSGDAGAASLLASGVAAWVAKPFDQDAVRRVLVAAGRGELGGAKTA